MKRLFTDLISWFLAGVSLTFAPYCLLLAAIGFAGKLADSDFAFNRQVATVLMLEALATFLATAAWFLWIRPRVNGTQ